MITGSLQLAGRTSLRSPILSTKPTASGTTTTVSAETSSSSVKSPRTKAVSTPQRAVYTVASRLLPTSYLYTTALASRASVISARLRSPPASLKTTSMCAPVVLSSVPSAASTFPIVTLVTTPVYAEAQDQWKNLIWRWMWMRICSGHN